MRSLTPLISVSSSLRRRASAFAARPGRKRHRGCTVVSAAYVIRLPSPPCSVTRNRSASRPSSALEYAGENVEQRRALAQVTLHDGLSAVHLLGAGYDVCDPGRLRAAH